MKRRLTGLVRIGAWTMVGLLAVDIGLQMGGFSIAGQWDWRGMGQVIAGKFLRAAVNQANPAAAYIYKKQSRSTLAEYVPSPEDIEAISEENSAVLLEDMAGENEAAVEEARAESESEPVETEPAAGTEYVETLAGVPTGEIYSEKALSDYDFVLGHFYTVDPSTSAGSTLIDGADLTGRDMTIQLEGEEPKILIYHTHSQEGYADSKAGNAADTVVGVGEQLKKVLEEKYHVAVYHDLSVYDMQDGKEDRNMAYSQAAVAVRNILEENPSIEVTIDLHRDGVPDNVHLATEINGKETAQIMFLNGLCRNSNGDVNNFAQNPNLTDNLAFSLQLQLKAKAYFPDLVRHIYLRAYRYNLHFKPRSLLVEVGAQNNTVAEAKNAMEPLADILYAVLSGK